MLIEETEDIEDVEKSADCAPFGFLKLDQAVSFDR